MLLTAPLPTPGPEVLPVIVDNGGSWWQALVAALVGAVVGGLITAVVSWKIHQRDSKEAQKLQAQSARDARALQARESRDALRLQQQSAQASRNIQRSAELASHCDAILSTITEYTYDADDDSGAENWDTVGYQNPQFHRDFERHAARILMWSADRKAMKTVLDRLFQTLDGQALEVGQLSQKVPVASIMGTSALPYGEAVMRAFSELTDSLHASFVGLPSGAEVKILSRLNSAIDRFEIACAEAAETHRFRPEGAAWLQENS